MYYRCFPFHGEISSPSVSLFSNMVNKSKLKIMDAAFAPSRPPGQSLHRLSADGCCSLACIYCQLSLPFVVVVVVVSYFLAARWRCAAPMPSACACSPVVRRTAVASGVWNEVSRRRDRVTRAVSCLARSLPSPAPPLSPSPPPSVSKTFLPPSFDFFFKLAFLGTHCGPEAIFT